VLSPNQSDNQAHHHYGDKLVADVEQRQFGGAAFNRVVGDEAGSRESEPNPKGMNANTSIPYTHRL